MFRSTQTESGFGAPLPPPGFGVAAVDAREALDEELLLPPFGVLDAPAGPADAVDAGEGESGEAALAVGAGAGLADDAGLADEGAGAGLAELAAGGAPFFFATNFESFGKAIVERSCLSSAEVPRSGHSPQLDAVRDAGLRGDSARPLARNIAPEDDRDPVRIFVPEILLDVERRRPEVDRR